MTSRQAQVHFLLPAGRTEQYYPIIVAAISQELAELIDHYAYILFSADIFLRYQHPTCEEGIVPPLPDEDWEQLRQWVTVRQARKAEDRLQQQMWQTQRLRDALLNADVNIAEALVESGDIPGAITLLSRVAAWFAHERDGYQAARYAQRAAQLAHQINDVSTAVDHVLLVAYVYFHDTLSPELAQRDIQHGVDLATEVGDPVLLVRLSLAQAQIAFATLDDPHVREYLEEAQRYLTNIINTEERALLAYRIALLHARCAVVWEEWSTARHVLEEVLAAHPPTAHDICFDVLALLLAVLTEWHEAAAADRVYTVALALISDTDRRRLGLFHMHYATSLARRGELDTAYQTYQKAIHILDGVAEQYDLCILYQNMKSTLGRADNSFIQDLALYESTRIDLFHRTKGLNRGYRHEQKAAKSLVSAQPREVLRHLRLALYHYWADGAYFSLFGAYRLLSSLYSSHGYVVDALLAMIRTGETKRVKHLAEHITREADSQMVQTIITRLIEPSPAPHELPTVAHTLGILADVTPPPLLDSTLEYLIDLIRAPVQMMKQRFTRLESFHALANFVPQLNADQTNTIVNLALEIGQESHHWTVMEALIDLLNNCFIETHCRVDPTNYARVLAFAMAQIPNSMDGTHVERLIVHMGRTAPTDVRAAIIEHIKSSRSNDIHKLIDLAFLAVPVAEETIAPTITRIMEAINREPQVTVQDGREVTQWSFGGVSPGVLLHLTPLVPTQLHSTLVDGLLRAIINEHNDLGLRSAAATTLSELPVEFVENRADEVADYLLLCLEEELVTASYVASALASQRNVFSNFTMNLGAIETVQRTCLRGLGKLYRHVNQNRQDRVCQQIVQAGRHSHPELRQGAVMALEGLEGHPFPSRLLFTLVALLHDPDVQTCSWACAATAQLLERGMVSDYAEDLVERLCNLATSSSVDIRTGVAVAIGRLYQGNVVNETVQQTCGTLLDQLMEDVSHRVRRQAVAFRNNPL